MKNSLWLKTPWSHHCQSKPSIVFPGQGLLLVLQTFASQIISSNHKCKIFPSMSRAFHLPWESPQLLFHGKTFIKVNFLLKFLTFSKNFRYNYVFPLWVKRKMPTSLLHHLQGHLISSVVLKRGIILFIFLKKILIFILFLIFFNFFFLILCSPALQER